MLTTSIGCWLELPALWLKRLIRLPVSLLTRSVSLRWGAIPCQLCEWKVVSFPILRNPLLLLLSFCVPWVPLPWLGLCRDTLTSTRTPRLHQTVMHCIVMWGLSLHQTVMHCMVMWGLSLHQTVMHCILMWGLSLHQTVVMHSIVDCLYIKLLLCTAWLCGDCLYIKLLLCTAWLCGDYLYIKLLLCTAWLCGDYLYIKLLLCAA